jgi:hypothetical protein
MLQGRQIKFKKNVIINVMNIPHSFLPAKANHPKIPYDQKIVALTNILHVYINEKYSQWSRDFTCYLHNLLHHIVSQYLSQVAQEPFQTTDVA